MDANRALVLCLGCSALLGCYLSSGDNPNNNTNPTTDSGTTWNPPANDLPCDVAAALTVCQGCHNVPPTNGATITLASYADLTAVAGDGRTEAEHAVDRMNGNPTQMPPAPASAVPQSDITTLQNWIGAGYPTGTCGVTNPYNTPTVCTSGKNGTTHESSAMRPGEACIACHQGTGGEAPVYPFMGTVYPTAHEPDDCVGASATSYSGVQVILTDSNGTTTTLVPNSAGNFYGGNSVAYPYTAKIVYQNRERDMTTPQTTGDCNSCHTVDGTNGAPGRIMLP